jgi:hypothetical protein
MIAENRTRSSSGNKSKGMARVRLITNRRNAAFSHSARKHWAMMSPMGRSLDRSFADKSRPPRRNALAHEDDRARSIEEGQPALAVAAAPPTAVRDEHRPLALAVGFTLSAAHCFGSPKPTPLPTPSGTYIGGVTVSGVSMQLAMRIGGKSGCSAATLAARRPFRNRWLARHSLK